MPKRRLEIDGEIDAEIVEIIKILNTHPGMTTIGSCAGHFRACIPPRAYAEWNMYERDEDWDPLCSCSGAPYLQFAVEDGFLESFLSQLENPPNIPGGIILHKHESEYSIQHGSGETIHGNPPDSFISWEFPVRPHFVEFWNFVVNAWNTSVAPQYHITAPTRFPVDHKCFQCKQ